jgi:hypothetical protein
VAAGSEGLTNGDGVGACRGDRSALGDTSSGVASGLAGDAGVGVTAGTVVVVGGGGGGAEDGGDEQAHSIKTRMVFPVMEMPGVGELMPREMQEECHGPA